MMLLTSLAALALVLAALGIFALVSSVVTDRQREFGIRLALGSPVSDSMLVAGRSGVMPAVVGLASGLALALMALRAMRSALFGVSRYDPLTLIATGALVAGCSRQSQACSLHCASHAFNRRWCCARNKSAHEPALHSDRMPSLQQARSGGVRGICFSAMYPSGAVRMIS